MKRIDGRWIWMGLGIFALLIRAIACRSPQWVETWYAEGLYAGIRTMLDFTICRLPFPVVYLLFAALVFFIYRAVRNDWRKRKERNRLQRWASRLKSAGAIVGAVIFLFLFLWGYNYCRIPLAQHLQLQTQPLDSTGIRMEVDHYTDLAVSIRNEIPNVQPSAVDENYLPEGMEKKVRQSLEKVLTDMGYNANGRVRGRVLKPNGILMNFSVAGIYIPFTGEGHIDGALHPVTYPYTLAHEMAHGYGFTDEGTCNFLALLACSVSDDPMIRYSGYLSHSRYVLSEYRRALGRKYLEFRATLDPGLVADMDAINQRNASFPDWIPTYQLNNAYLKAQGVKEGILSYNKVVLMAHAWRKRQQYD